MKTSINIRTQVACNKCFEIVREGELDASLNEDFTPNLEAVKEWFEKNEVEKCWVCGNNTFDREYGFTPHENDLVNNCVSGTDDLPF